MKDLVAGVIYNFKLTWHAKIQLAFRHKVAHAANDLSATFDGKHKQWTPDRALFKLILSSGKKVPVILKGDTIVTVYPNSAVMQSASGQEFCHCISTALTVSPELYSLQEIVDWSKRFEKDQGSLRVHHLQRDIRERATSWSEDTNSLVRILADATVKIERLESEIRTLQAANEALLSLPVSQPKSRSASTVETPPIADIETPESAESTDEILFGIIGAGDLIAHNASNNPIYRFSDCEVLQINEADPSSNDAHEIIFMQNKKKRVLSTAFPKYLSEYQLGDKEIFTAFVNGQHHVNSRPYNYDPAKPAEQGVDPSRFLRVTKLLTLKAFHLGRGIASSATLAQAIHMVKQKITSLQDRSDCDNRLPLFYKLLLAESLRGKNGDISARQEAQHTDQQSDLGMYEMYMEVVEQTQGRVTVDRMTGRHMGGNSIEIQKSVPILSDDKHADAQTYQIIDIALATLGYSDSDLTESELNFIYRWPLTDLIESDGFIGTL